MNLDILKSEIADDPLTKGYSSMTDQAITDSLNTVDITIKEVISSSEMLAWSGGGARYMKLKNGADSGADDTIKSICWAALEMIKRDGTTFDFNLSDRVAMLDALVTASVLSAEDKTALEALANKTISRGTQLGLGIITVGHVQESGRI